MTSSYLRTSLRISALRPSTVFWARSIALETILASMGRSSGIARSMTHDTAPVANRRIRSSSRRQVEPALAGVALAARTGRAAGCRCAATRGARCRARRARPSSMTPRASAGARRAQPARALVNAASNSSDARLEALRATASRRARPSALPPRTMSTPRPAMLVATVTACRRPAWATISASRKCCLALSTSWGTPALDSSRLSSSDFSTDGGAQEDRLAAVAALAHVLDDRGELRGLGLVDEVGLVARARAAGSSGSARPRACRCCRTPRPRSRRCRSCPRASRRGGSSSAGSRSPRCGSPPGCARAPWPRRPGAARRTSAAPRACGR